MGHLFSPVLFCGQHRSEWMIGDLGVFLLVLFFFPLHFLFKFFWARLEGFEEALTSYLGGNNVY